MHMTRHRFLSALLAAVSVVACSGYDKTSIQDITAPLSGARVKFFNFGVNAPAVNFYVNDTKVTAISSSLCQGVTDTATVRICNTVGIEATTGTASGSAGSAGLYSAIAPAQYTFNARVATTTDKGVQIAAAPMTLVDGGAYSFYVSGFYDGTTKKAEAFIVEDPIPATFDFDNTYVRLVNAISNSSPMTLSATNTVGGTATAVGSAVAYKAAGAFVKLTPGVYDLATRTAGATTDAITRTAVSFVAGRIYTVTARGDITVTSTTATNRPQLDNTANR
jgi:hypothetical protein